jgi:hypothetical protein
MTRAQLVELIQRDINNGLPFDDAQITDNEISLWLGQAIATVMEERYKTSSEMESITYMNDMYYATFKNRVVSKDTDTGYYYLSLPQVPLGLPRGIAIAGVYFKSGEGQLTDTVIQIAPQEIDIMRVLPMPKNKIFGWTEGSCFYMMSYKNLKDLKAIVRMVTSEATPDDVDIPDNIGLAATDLVIRRLKSRMGIQDISNDGNDIK